jgi:hypothetical protein
VRTHTYSVKKVAAQLGARRAHERRRHPRARRRKLAVGPQRERQERQQNKVGAASQVLSKVEVAEKVVNIRQYS